MPYWGFLNLLKIIPNFNVYLGIFKKIGILLENKNIKSPNSIWDCWPLPVKMCVFTFGLYTADASSSTMGGARSSYTTTSSPSNCSTSLTDTKAMQSSATGVSKPGVSEPLLANKTGRQQTAPLRWTVLNISPPPEDLLDSSQMSCQDEGGGPESEQSGSMWTEDSMSNFSNMSSHSYNDNNEVPRKSRKRNTKQKPGAKRRDSNMDVFDADSAKAPHFVLYQLGSDSKSGSQAGNGLVFVFYYTLPLSFLFGTSCFSLTLRTAALDYIVQLN